MYIHINTQQGGTYPKIEMLCPTYVARGTVVISRTVAGETVHQIFTCSVIHARITGALVDVCNARGYFLHPYFLKLFLLE